VSDATKVNNNRLLEEENLAFIGCDVDVAVVGAVEVNAADRSQRGALLS
jgi:hypothetical protein